MRRGRGLKQPGPGRPPTKSPLAKAGTITFKVTARDEEMVTCSLCQEVSTFREFRLHNLSKHYNLATTADDTTLLDHKFYAKRLNEMAKLMKLTSFTCPSPVCPTTTKYKSTLGLAYHLETCGKTVEEVEACLLECDICHGKFTLPNLNWHKRTQHKQIEVYNVDEEVPQEPAPQPETSKRQSAVKAREFMKEISEFTTSTAGDEAGLRPSCQLDRDAIDEDFVLPAACVKRELEDEDWPPEDWVAAPNIDCLLGIGEIKEEAGESESTRGVSSMVSTRSMDFPNQAVKYLETHLSLTDRKLDNVWDTPGRNFVDPFPSEKLPSENSMEPLSTHQEASPYLPSIEVSVEFRSKVEKVFDPSQELPENPYFISDYHRLKRFEDEEMNPGTVRHIPNKVAFTGGPVSAMAWHPSGRFLAVASLKHYDDNADVTIAASRSTSIQIYTGPDFHLELVVAFDAGFVNHLKWAAYWPVSCDTHFNTGEEPIPDEHYRIGYLAAACEDATVRIIVVRREHFELPQNYAGSANSKIRVYRKVPEMTLCLDEGSKQDSGQCIRFDWHEDNRYIVAGYGNGLVAVFDCQTTSRLLRRHDLGVGGNQSSVTTLFPFWLINTHLAAVSGVNFDPTSSRYFYTGSMDRTVKAWDMELRSEIDSKKVGCILDTCFIRGWIHLAVSVDVAVSNPGAQFNFARYYQLGSSKGVPNQLEYFNITSMSFYEGMTLTGTESGRVSVTYFDSFWRECDYDRNKKKRNIVNISQIEVDKTSFPPTPFVTHESQINLNDDTEPRIDLIVTKNRPTQTLEEPGAEDAENLFRFYRFLRVNKVSWCPKGKFLAVGYRNGLLTILPASHEKLYV